MNQAQKEQLLHEVMEGVETHGHHTVRFVSDNEAEHFNDWLYERREWDRSLETLFQLPVGPLDELFFVNEDNYDRIKRAVEGSDEA